MSICRSITALIVPLLFVTMFASVETASAQFNGAIYTTMPDGQTVNENVGFPTKAHVYLNGGPQNANGAGLPDGIYYYQVTTPSGDLLSTDPANCRQAVVVDGKMAGALDVGGCQHANAAAPNPDNGSLGVQLIPYDDTTNSGGEYKVWLIRQTDTTSVAPDGIVILFRNSDAKTDNFKVQLATPTPTPPLEPVGVSKTANASYDRTVTWTIEKTVDPASHTGYAGEVVGSSTWTVTASKSEVSDNYSVSGVITISNTNSSPVMVTVNDALNDSSPAVIDCDPNTEGDQFANVAVPGALDQNTPGVLTCSYTAASSPGATENTVSVFPVTPDLPQGEDATVSFEFVENLIGDDEVVVDDDRDTEDQFPDTINDDATYDYSESFSCSRNLDDYTNGEYSYTLTNIATLVGDNTNLSDAASVVVTCKLRYEDETATGAGLGWPGANWFMYTPCADALFPSSVNLIAGQHYDVGDVTITGTCPDTKNIGPGTNLITITLQNGARLADTSNNVKIHPMGETPKKSIAPGQYSIKRTFAQGTTVIEITVPTAKYYGIHLDVQRLILP